MSKIGIIGVGNMGFAMLKGLLKVYSASDIVITDADKKKAGKIADELNVRMAESNPECVAAAKYVILAVKPQFYNEVIKTIQYALKPEHVLISIAPGISIHDLKENLGLDKRIVRAMPNTPALLGEGMTGIAYNSSIFNMDEIDTIESIFSSFGKFEKVDEKLMSAVTCVSGSSPAYVYMFIEALADSVVKYGMPRDKAYKFAAQAVAGSAKMVLETKEHPGKLKDNVCSPGGTTIAGVAALEEYGFRNAVIKATDECFRKCEGN